MKRTVREESGAWLLLKNAPVRANATATSFAFCSWPKFPAAVAGAFCVRNTPSTKPARSTTATTISTSREFTAAVTIFCTRSEEHTSELQSHSDLVCRLLLEKKKKK